MNYRQVSEFINSNTGGSDDTMMIIAVMIIIISCTLSLLGGYLSLLRAEGDKCVLKDDKYADGILDEEGKCKFMQCKDTYDLDVTGKCVLDQSGKDCTPEETPIVNGIYNTNVSNVCEFVGCTIGYLFDEDGICAEIEDELPDELPDEESVPVNCEATLSDWSDCSEPCNRGGTQTRSLTIQRNEYNEGECPEKLEPREQSCNTDIDCYEIDGGRETSRHDLEGISTSNLAKMVDDIDCNRSYYFRGGLNKFQLHTENFGNRSLIEYKFKCLGHDKMTYAGSKYDEKESPAEATDGDTRHLDGFPVDCGEYPISSFKWVGANNTYQRYKFKCLDGVSHTGVCRELDTGWDTSGYDVRNLKTHDVKCGEDEVITKFVLKNNTEDNKFRYDYTCCKMPY